MAAERPGQLGFATLFDSQGVPWDCYCVNSLVSIRPAVCHGKPVIAGTRVLVSTILGALAAGDSFETLMEDYPGLTRGDISAAIEFAGKVSDYQVSAYKVVG